ncbi:prefoldin subunit 3 [Strongylocentrotus purpuratus]|uniref:Prefoldin subunit 3 n=1 Tax=Strongylocentrotus purpuratus TaxID=7668 RepID=A0A7M7RH83_STRPU|nr:prefoldin subunit 3 [Strongylocentrotus purpuratus]|eukprot:XP_797937.1 PREDICTED: prefoldin subunit 3 [Strongylocentrotus purpuratus]
MAGDGDKTLAKAAGIPEAVFVEDVDSFMQKPQNESAEVVLKRLEEQHQKYKFMEMNLLQKKRRLRGQIPDIRTTLDIVKHLQSKQGSEDELKTQFLLSDQVYAKASILPTKKVCLWLGANVMLEYELSDAEALLSKNLKAATESQTQVDLDLDFLRDQYTTTEVNMARVYNFDVKRRQAAGKLSS